jgi:hypothetical protein
VPGAWVEPEDKQRIQLNPIIMLIFESGSEDIILISLRYARAGI